MAFICNQTQQKVMSAYPINNPKLIKAWCMYDWANSSFALTIGSAVFPAYWGATAIGANGSDVVSFFGYSITASVLYSYALSIAFLWMSITVPLLTGVADASKRKLDFMRFFTYLGGISCAALFFFTPETTQYAIVFFMLAYIAFGSSLVFYNSFLPDLVSDNQIDSVSARGFSMGYIGSVLLLILNLALILFGSNFGINAALASRVSFVSVGVWWIGFAQISFKALHKPDLPPMDWSRKTVLSGLKELQLVWLIVKSNEAMKGFLPAYFFYNMGVQTILLVAALFGEKEIKLETQQLIIVILIIQLIAILGARITSWASSKLGNKLALQILVVMWIVICLLAWNVQNANQFYGLAVLVGIIMGGSQSLSRSTYAKLIPSNSPDTASFFSFFDVTEKVSIVIGTASYGLVEAVTGSMRNSILGLIAFFVLGLVLLVIMPNSKVLNPVLPLRK
jgi:UMF1 family MFS transporter